MLKTSYKGLTIQQTEEFRIRAAPIVSRHNQLDKILDEQERDFTMTFEEWEILFEEREALKEAHFALRMDILNARMANYREEVMGRECI